MMALHRWLAMTNGGLVVCFLLTLWIPPWWRQRVSTPPVDQSDVRRWRAQGDSSAATTLWRVALDWDAAELWATDVVGDADQILADRLRLAGKPAVNSQDLDWDADPFQDPTWQLQLQALTHARILLAAWHITGRQAYLSKAGEVISSWIRFARSRPFGGGLIWNDHVMADRAVVLSAFWAAYARSPNYDAQVATTVLRSIAQHVGFLTDPRHFTPSTNHGIIQNLGLLHIAGTLPELAERGKAVDVAVRRLTLQYRMLATPEGVWAEHSPGYSLFALQMLRSAPEYLRIAGRRIPDEWRVTQSRLERVLVQFARRDGSLPPIGDTYELPRAGHPWPREMLARVHGTERARAFLAPCGGYAVLWENKTAVSPASERQVVMTVADFAGRSHKHADELSTYVYSDGVTWLTGPGYWPYASSERVYATGWTGANAPAYENEPAESSREAKLLGYAQAGWGELVRMERTGPSGFRAERQVVWVRPDWLIVADKVSARSRRIVLRWLWSPDALVVDGGIDEGWSARAVRGPSKQRLRLWVLSESPPTITVARGAEGPFRGWVYTGRTANAEPAPVLEIRPPGEDAFVVSVLHFEPASSNAPRSPTPRLQREGNRWSVSFADGFELSASLGGHPSHVTLARRAMEDNASIQPLSCPAEVQRAHQSQRAALHAEFGQLSGRPQVPLTRYRDVTLLLVGIYLSQELGLVLIKRKSRVIVVVIRLCSCLVLIAGAIVLMVRWWGTAVV